MKDTEIDLLTDVMVMLLTGLMRLNNDELTKEDFNEIIKVAMTIMLPLTEKRLETIKKMLN